MQAAVCGMMTPAQNRCADLRGLTKRRDKYTISGWRPRHPGQVVAFGEGVPAREM